MSCFVFTNSGLLPSFEDIFDGSVLNVTIDGNARCIIIHTRDIGDVVIYVNYINQLNGGKNIKKNNKKSRKSIRKSKKNERRKFTKKIKRHIIGGVKPLKLVLLFFITYILNFLFPFNLSSTLLSNPDGPRVSDSEFFNSVFTEDINIELKERWEFVKSSQLNIKSIGPPMKINLALLNEDETSFDIQKIQGVDIEKIKQYTLDKTIAAATITNGPESPTRQLTKLMPKLPYVDSLFGHSGRMYAITSHWTKEGDNDTFKIELYNTTREIGVRSRNFPENKQLDSLIKAMVNEQLEKIHSLGMVPIESLEGWFDFVFFQITPTINFGIDFSYHLDTHGTLRDTRAPPNSEIIRSQDYGRNISVPSNVTNYFVSPYASVQTMTYANEAPIYVNEEPIVQSRPMFKMAKGTPSKTTREFRLEGGPGEETIFLNQELGTQHSQATDVPNEFPYKGKERLLILGSFMPKTSEYQQVSPEILVSKR
jgi:hypothetical protein